MPIFHHVRRKRNKAADWIANKVMDEGQNYTRCEVENLSSFIGSLATGDDHLLHCRFDGGYRKLQNKASAGIRIQYSRIQSQVAKQVNLVQMGNLLQPMDSFQSELEAALFATTQTRIFWAKFLNFVVTSQKS